MISEVVGVIGSKSLLLNPMCVSFDQTDANLPSYQRSNWWIHVIIIVTIWCQLTDIKAKETGRTKLIKKRSKRKICYHRHTQVHTHKVFSLQGKYSLTFVRWVTCFRWIWGRGGQNISSFLVSQMTADLINVHLTVSTYQSPNLKPVQSSPS